MSVKTVPTRAVPSRSLHVLPDYEQFPSLAIARAYASNRDDCRTPAEVHADLCADFALVDMVNHGGWAEAMRSWR